MVSRSVVICGINQQIYGVRDEVNLALHVTTGELQNETQVQAQAQALANKDGRAQGAHSDFS
jgi:hypothetical protein